ncbi:MAG: hypothetical protein ACYTF1_11690 [Planctomycetota bacterium]
MKVLNKLLVSLVWLVVVSAVAAGGAKVEKKTVALESLDGYITCELFDPDFTHGDNAYTGIVSASDGKIYFVVGSHNPDHACRFFSFDPADRKLSLIAKMDEVVGEDEKKQYSQGKVHTRIYEHKQKLWFATHTAYYQTAASGVDYAPVIDYKGKGPYRGGHFMSYDLYRGKFTSLARTLPNEGIITMAMDKKAGVLYGLTWPSGILMSYDINSQDFRSWGAVQGRGEWEHKPFKWDMICRTLGVDANSFVYGSTMDGRIWKYDPAKLLRVSFIKGLDLKRVPFSQSATETVKGEFRNNWRTIEWNRKTKSFWGLHFECSTLFEFVPVQNYLRAVAELGHEAYHGMPRNPEISQLGFTIGPKNTIFYLAHGPAVTIEGRKDMQSSLYLITYQIDKAKYTNHGPILSGNKRRVFFSESIAIGPDDGIYTVAWVEITDPQRAAKIMAARLQGAPDETQQTAYEMLLVRLPRWQTFVK